MPAPTKTESATATAQAQIPAVPLTLEGSAVLHQMFRFHRADWRKLTPELKSGVVREAEVALAHMEHHQTALYSLFGHKGDLMLVHFRNSFAELKQAELDVSKLRLTDYLEPTHSYLSVVELGLYDSSAKIYQQLADSGLQPHSESWKAAIEEQVSRQRETMRPRLWPEIPSNPYVCFYPMDRKRGEDKNWYMLPIAERQRQMHEHGMVGRRYAGEVRQIITGSIGFDDWEWGVDLFADDPLVFKKLIYEMRFDQVSAIYALFGSFYVGVRCPAAQVGALLECVAPEQPASR